MVQGKINRDRHTDHPAGHHFIWTNQCPPLKVVYIIFSAVDVFLGTGPKGTVQPHSFHSSLLMLILPSEPWHCWLGGRKGIWPVKNMGDGGSGTAYCLVWMEWHSAGWLVCLPLLIFPCTIKSRSSLLASAHPAGPGKRAVKWLWCGYWCWFSELTIEAV